ncbi:MAG TPA: bifunctional 5,10-methylenetetrahydrofolate dehydrogenase/5,10-methenyltetrahydrofolate cyclohydrolase [Methylocella sp.]|nr:bifunctional 5,10-methylenetetrahydrofolate dehydrogenase/5,10-methenyltetrahydrofolate cyclohydrolase [Methylocella sp.]
MRHLYSKDIVTQRKARLVESISALKEQGIRPKLTAIVCSGDSAARSYVAVKRKHTNEVGGAFEAVDLSGVRDDDDDARAIKTLCARPDVHGVILVMSSKPQTDELDLANLIPAEKDVDGLSASNLGALVQHGAKQRFTVPATPQACIVLASSVTEIAGKRVAVIGRGRTVGRPLANMLISGGATVTVCHSGTTDIARISREAEIVFVATGRPKRFGKEYFRDGQVVIDAGIGFIDGQLSGDVDSAALTELDLTLTPVPGGVGPLTSVLILDNLLQLIKNGKNIREEIARAHSASEHASFLQI